MKKTLTLLSLLLYLNINAQETILHYFTGGTDGFSPVGSLISDGTYLYGMTEEAGVYGNGTIYKVKTDGTGYQKLWDFNYSNGAVPLGALLYDGVYLYGMTQQGGGLIGVGNIFKIKPDGTGFDTLLTFNLTNGSQPQGSLISDGTYLYGMTYAGGTYNDGVLFKIKPDGTGYVKLLNFHSTSGTKPFGSLYYDGAYLYGLTHAGGVNSVGNLFKIKPDGTGYTNLLNLHGSPASSGSFQGCTLVSDGTYLYGMMQEAGTYNKGNVFKIKKDSTNYTEILEFDNTNGAYPTGSLIYDGNYLYGMAEFGGPSNVGNVFKLKPDGTGYTNLLNFNISNGANPMSGLYSDGTYLYGTASDGGANEYGVVFRLCLMGETVNSPTVCAGDTATLTVNGTGSYTWSPSVGLNTTIGNTVISTSTANVTYTVTGTAAGCTNTFAATASVTIHPLPIVTINSPTICLGDSGTLIAYGANTYTWSNGVNTNSITVNPSLSYTVIGEDTANCFSKPTSPIINTDPPPVIIIRGNDSICNGQSTILTAAGANTYTWNTGNTSASVSFTPTTTTSYSVAGTAGICVSNTTVSITVIPNPTISINSDETICVEQNIKLTANGAISYTWSTGDTTASVTLSPKTTTNYTITGAVGGCNSQTITTVTVKDPFSFILPNIVTPNNDGINDFIDFEKYQFSSLSIVIYNRWGDNVFESTNPACIWKPTQDDGTYFFTAQYQINCQGKTQSKSLKGFITVIR